MGRSLQCYILDGLRTLQGAIRRERPANQPALRPFTNLNHFYPVVERGDSRTHSAGGMRLGAAGIRSTEYGYTQNLYTVRIESRIPLVKVLESLEIGLLTIQF